ncbi:MAG: glycosyltransferase family 39 protein [Thermoguttaceae bacterium]
MGPNPSGSAWRGWTLLAVGLAGVVFFYPLLLAPHIPIIDPDEGLHAAIAQEMVERGDWIVPRFLGTPFLDKPVFYFWAQALSLKCLGMSEAAIRLPGLFFGLLGAVTTMALAWRMLGRVTGLLAGLFYMTSVLPTALAQVPVHDVALVPWVNLALLCCWESDTARSYPAALAMALPAGLVLGLAILTKGLVGVALVALAFGGYLLLARRLRAANWLFAAMALVVACLVASAWYLAVERQNPGYLRYFILERHLLAFATGTQRHGHAPWWYYLPILVGGGMPWIAYLPILVEEQWRQRRHSAEARRQDRPPRPLLLAGWWLLGSTLLLSVAHSKLITYLWPVFPAVAILVAALWARRLEGRLSPRARQAISQTVWWTCLAGPLTMPVLCRVVQWEFSLELSRMEWLVAALTSLAAMVPLWAWLAGRVRTTLTLGTLATAMHFVVIMTMIMPRVATGKTARPLAEHFNRLDRFPPRLVVTDSRIGSFFFYLKPDHRLGLLEDRTLMVDLQQAADRLPDEGEMLIVPEWRFYRLLQAPRERYFDLYGADYQWAGRYRVYGVSRLEEARNPWPDAAVQRR